MALNCQAKHQDYSHTFSCVTSFSSYSNFYMTPIKLSEHEIRKNLVYAASCYTFVIEPMKVAAVAGGIILQ